MSETPIEVRGYRLIFKRDLTAPTTAAETQSSPYRGDYLDLAYEIQGEPGLIDVRFHFSKIHDKPEDGLVRGFSAVLAPAGTFTAWTRRQAIYRGVVEVPVRLFPTQVEIEIKNLSETL
jgi:hypothetical protein